MECGGLPPLLQRRELPMFSKAEASSRTPQDRFPFLKELQNEVPLSNPSNAASRSLKS
jgi:hypothetical protein